MHRKATSAGRIIHVLSIVGGSAACVACTDAVAPNAVGVWGGPHVLLKITNVVDGVLPAGTGTVEFDCAHGSISLPVEPNKSGRFDVAGSYVQEHGGPIRADQPLTAKPAHYFGEINGNRMTLSVARTDSAWSVGPFSLERGVAGSVFKCL